MLTFSGEKLSADFEAVTKIKEKFENLINENDLCGEQVYNLDEICLYFRLVPEKILTSTKEAAAPGYKKSKNRVILSLSSNAAGTHEFPLMVIKKSAKP